MDQLHELIQQQRVSKQQQAVIWAGNLCLKIRFDVKFIVKYLV